MDIRVRFFGFSADVTGCGECTVEVHEPGTVQTVWDQVAHRFPKLASSRSALRFARNTDYADPQTHVSHGDIISIIPPVAGG